MNRTRTAVVLLALLPPALGACPGARGSSVDAGSGGAPLDAEPGDGSGSGAPDVAADDGAADDETPDPDVSAPDVSAPDVSAPDAPSDGSAEGGDGSGAPDASEPDAATDAGPSGPCPAFGLPQRRARLPGGITEASGLAVSRRDPRVVWVHNDSGDGPRVHAVDVDSGTLLGSVTLEADATDWEDMAIGPCGDDVSRDCIVVADIGDNADRRERVTLYRFVEPALADASLVPARLDVVYPDGPRDAESVFVAPDGTVWIVSKDDGSGGLYSVDWSGEPATSPVELTRHGAIDLSGLIAGNVELATGADFSALYSRLLVRTYTSIVELRLPPGGTMASLVSVPYTTLPVGLELQGETVAWGPEGYFHVAEGANAQLWEVRCSDAPALP